MKHHIHQKTENDVLSRVEVEGTITFDAATPSRQELVKAIAADLKVSHDLVVIRSIRTRFGKREAAFTAQAYKHADAMAAEQKHLIARGKPKQETKKE